MSTTTLSTATSAATTTTRSYSYKISTVTDQAFPTAFGCSKYASTNARVGLQIGVGVSPPTEDRWPGIVSCCADKPIIVGGSSLQRTADDGGNWNCVAWCAATNETIRALNNCYYQQDNPVKGLGVECDDDGQGGCDGASGVPRRPQVVSTKTTSTIATNTTSAAPAASTSGKSSADNVSVKKVGVLVIAFSVLVLAV